MRFTTTDAARLRGAASRLLDEHHLPGIAVGNVAELHFARGMLWSMVRNAGIEPWA